MRRKFKPPSIANKWYFGLVFVFGLEDGRLRALIQDAYLNKMCTGATGALGVKYLSRPESKTVGIIGSGWQARGQLKAVSAVRKLTAVKVFSPTQETRETFAREMTKDIGVDVKTVGSYEEAVRGVDIIITATNSYDSFLRGEWLEPGQHIDAMGGGDRWNKMRELFVSVYAKSDIIAVNSVTAAQYDEPADVMEAIKTGATSWETLQDLGRIIAGKGSGRTKPSQITLHRHHTGLGLWYTAAGQKLYEAAVAAKAGKELPDEIFNQDFPT